MTSPDVLSRRELARLISRIERGDPEAQQRIFALYRRPRRAHVVGITGAPGSGKSTLIAALAYAMRRHNETVAILSVDPSSPFSGGALLGDRIRMRDLSQDPGIFIRSMASRGAQGGLSGAAADVTIALDAANFDRIIIETVGAGQADVDIAQIADTVVVVEAPGMGDDVQALKAGILEIADILVVNKADREGAKRMRLDLRNALELGGKPKGWNPPILLTEAPNGKGVEELVQHIQEHHRYQHDSGEWELRRLQQTEWELQSLVHDTLERQARDLTRTLFAPETLQQIVQGAVNPFPLLSEWLQSQGNG